MMNYYQSILTCTLCYILSGGVVNAANNNIPSTRIPFIPSARRAKKAYLNHLQNELQSAQRQLYVSQNTCNTLRKRCEDQRKESLLSMNTRNKDIEIENQQLEIDKLQVQLQRETDKQLQQEDRFNLIAAELNELQAEKDTQEEYNENKLQEYEQKMKDSKQQYDDQIDMLKLKLEAAEYVTKQKETIDGVESSSRNERAQLLRSELEGIRAKYSAMFIKTLEVGDTDQNQIVEDLDISIQSVVESALDTIDKDWSARYNALEEHISKLEKEKAASPSVVQADHEEIDSTQLREELTTELTETLTNQLTEKMEKKYKKKIRQLRKELKEATASVNASDDETGKINEQLKVEYEGKLQELQQKNEEQETFHKEQMRKLVKAVMDREANQKEQSTKFKLKKDAVEEETKASSSKKKKKKSASGSKDKVYQEDELRTSASSSRKRSKPSVVPVRRSNR